jgi:hypothetical protein
LLLACLASLGLAFAVGGCASSSAEQAPAPQAIAQRERVEVEADGLPSQVSPPNRIRQQPDESTEPFSRNYGSPPASRPTPAPVRMSAAQEDAIIAGAIAEHEMRRP